MKQSKFIKESGPYEVHSISQDGCGIRLEVFPAFPEYDISEKCQKGDALDPSWAKEPRWVFHRYIGEGGGPSIFTAIALAAEFERFLNQSYSEAEVTNWKKDLDQALKKIREKEQKRFEKAMAKMERE